MAEPVTGVVCRLRNERDAARRERDEARAKAKEYYDDIQQLAGEHQWEHGWAGDAEAFEWLQGPRHA